MQAMIPFPDISPEIFTLSLFGMEFALRWYALSYIVGILLGWRLVVASVKRPHLWPKNSAPMTPRQVEDLLTWVILGVILGGRLGFVLFYQPAYYLQNPLQILQVWQGGMSFHGGLLGVVTACLLYCQRQGLARLSVGDALCMVAPIGLLLGRIANFINAELWGRPTSLPWGVAFPGAAAQDCPDVIGICARHPSQLYEAALEGLILGAVLVFLAYRRGALKERGRITGLFFAGYGVSRFIVEFFRQADAQFITPDNPMGYALQMGAFGLSMGQLLSLPMIAFGLAMVAWAKRSRPA
ncbi:Prolipoprotein diacylglyceryl transferase [Roseovarius marisflavi]|uniref:Phosphatidylglycerol--prolipoprotein diacylglyceryl transferase n=1 Tax=Roseovarius marisflavi TaxID=1054996 RepID=A0A1M7A4J0_9RHOB|nr:prolipoprotein diacylglyceryl transferase [Roseovarius marisflavi]SHL37575.1 Prolipoprotein diacylglyceryl transferase [Roseovarius marisflavi]